MRFVPLLCMLLAQSLPVLGTSAMELDVGSVSDKRFELVRNTDINHDVSYLSTRFKMARDWQARAADLREQVLASAGLLPLPARTPLKARVFGKIDCDDYTIEKVCFESYPGFYCTGSLYRPKSASKTGKYPAILNPHGHWGRGRLEDISRGSIPGRCLSQARQGYIAFAYDMVGFNDSRQIPHDDTLATRRDRAWGVSLGGLQTWNSMRAIDFLESLPDVDKTRIACTGASGGGSQTFILSCVDDRLAFSAPVNMISAHMQGGCRCENLPNMRIDTDNVEITACAAPRPMLIVCATGDWTANTPKAEYPSIRSIYDLFGAGERVTYDLVDAEHNYNITSREAVYDFFGKYLPDKPVEGPIREQPFTLPSDEEMLVFPDGKSPDGAPDADGVVSGLIKSAESQLNSHRLTDGGSLKQFRKLYEPSLRHALSIPSTIGSQTEERGKLDDGSVVTTKLVIRDTARGIAIPALLFSPASPPKGAVLLVSDKGKSAFLNRQGTEPGALVAGLVARGLRVLAIDQFGVGEHVAPEGSPKRDYDDNFFDTYNRTDTAERVYDILVALDYLWTRESQVALVGSGKAGLLCLLARPFALRVDKLVVDAAGANISADGIHEDEFFVPCLRRAGDFRTAMALAAPADLMIHNTRGVFDTSWASSAYAAAKRPKALVILTDQADETDIARWLVTGDRETGAKHSMTEGV